jgi:hypothetical protein
VQIPTSACAVRRSGRRAQAGELGLQPLRRDPVAAPRLASRHTQVERRRDPTDTAKWAICRRDPTDARRLDTDKPRWASSGRRPLAGKLGSRPYQRDPVATARPPRPGRRVRSPRPGCWRAWTFTSSLRHAGKRSPMRTPSTRCHAHVRQERRRHGAHTWQGSFGSRVVPRRRAPRRLPCSYPRRAPPFLASGNEQQLAAPARPSRRRAASRRGPRARLS